MFEIIGTDNKEYESYIGKQIKYILPVNGVIYGLVIVGEVFNYLELRKLKIKAVEQPSNTELGAKLDEIIALIKDEPTPITQSVADKIKKVIG